MTLLNIRLGYWAENPNPYKNKTLRKMVRKKWQEFLSRRLPWWPYYMIQELCGSTHSKRWQINLSDGGHIENLGIYELLKRKCKLIIAFDAGADPDFNFGDLKHLIIMAKNNGLASIDFKKNDPAACIKPSLIYSYSSSHFAVADITYPSDNGKRKKGTLIYIKNSLIKEDMSLNGKTNAIRRYKYMNPDFPHETTADQFFDNRQWEAYYNLGKTIGDRLLKDMGVRRLLSGVNVKCSGS